MQRTLSSSIALCLLASAASAQSYSTGFEQPTFNPGNINAQGGWSQTNPAFVGNISNAAANTGSQSFLRSNAFAAGSFGDQTFSPGVGVGVGEPTANGATAGYNQMSATMWFRSAATFGDGSVLGWALTNSTGSRAWSINFLNNASDGGVVVRAFGAANDGLSFPAAPDVVLGRGVWHRIDVLTTYVPGESNDSVSISINGGAAFSISTWEQYYRYNPEQAGNGNQLWATDRFIWRSAGASVPAAQGFYFDDLTYTALPAPGSLALLGLGGLAAARRRRN